MALSCSAELREGKVRFKWGSPMHCPSQTMAVRAIPVQEQSVWKAKEGSGELCLPCIGTRFFFSRLHHASFGFEEDSQRGHRQNAIFSISPRPSVIKFFGGRRTYFVLGVLEELAQKCHWTIRSQYGPLVE